MAGKGRTILTTQEKIQRKQADINLLIEKKEQALLSYDQKIGKLQSELDELIKRQEQEKMQDLYNAIESSGRTIDEILAMLKVG